MHISLALSFDDVLIVPQYSNISSRKLVDIGYQLNTSKLGLAIPVVASCMNTISEHKMAIAMAKHGSFAIIHRYNTIEEQIKQVKLTQEQLTRDERAYIAAAVGVTGNYFERTKELIKNKVKIICIDVAHGYSALTLSAIEKIKTEFNNKVYLIAGNVAHEKGYIDLSYRGADAVRVGIGNGAACSTRIQTGCGYPLLSALQRCRLAKLFNDDVDADIISDGGARTSGDVAKALVFADYVMTGSLLAGTDECPGNRVWDNATRRFVKQYAGSASYNSKSKVSDKPRNIEGESFNAPYRGPVSDVLQSLKEGLQSAFSYVGANNMQEFKTRAELVRQTSAGQLESSPHFMIGK